MPEQKDMSTAALQARVAAQDDEIAGLLHLKTTLTKVIAGLQADIVANHEAWPEVREQINETHALRAENARLVETVAEARRLIDREIMPRYRELYEHVFGNFEESVVFQLAADYLAQPAGARAPVIAAKENIAALEARVREQTTELVIARQALRELVDSLGTSYLVQARNRAKAKLGEWGLL